MFASTLSVNKILIGTVLFENIKRFEGDFIFYTCIFVYVR